MSRNIYLTKFVVPATICLNPDQRAKALHLTNIYFLGRSQLKEDEKVTDAHHNAHNTIHTNKIVHLEVGLKSDGTYEVIRII